MIPSILFVLSFFGGLLITIIILRRKLATGTISHHHHAIILSLGLGTTQFISFFLSVFASSILSGEAISKDSSFFGVVYSILWYTFTYPLVRLVLRNKNRGAK